MRYGRRLLFTDCLPLLSKLCLMRQEVRNKAPNSIDFDSLTLRGSARFDTSLDFISNRIPRLRLNAVQLEILEFVKHGHNVMITGQGGVGKSEVVKSIVSSLNATGKKVGVVCSSGIATQVYDKGVASTVHSFYGLQTAELPSDKLIERSIESDVVRVRVEAVDSVIWDEASMSSQRMLELANALHHRLSDEDSSSFPFAGKHIVLVGEFLQLRPVPNCFDDGNFMFMSRLYCSAISHRFELTELMRQSEADEMFLSALKEVRLGECSGATEDYLATLSRDLDEEKERSATHIFFKKIPALLFNRSVLSQQPGVLYTFNAVAEKEDDNKMNWPGQSVLHLKVGCRVMLVWNKSPQLKNGTMGVFCGMENEMLRIDFPGVGTVSISRETWVRRNRRGDKVGSITQYPIVLAYGITCHKAQGLTLPSAIVHCSTEFVPGLIYVAASRVKDAGDLQLLNFNRKQLLKPTPKVIEQCSTAHTSDPCADLSCCRRKILNDATLFNVSDRFSEENEGDEYFTFPIEMFDGPAQASFNEEESLIPLEMNDLFLRVDKCESIISSPPSDLKPTITEVLAGLKVKETSEFAVEENRVIDSLLATGQSKLHAFLKIIWFHSFLLIKSYITENSGNAGELLVDISRQAFTDATASLNELWCSQDFARYVCGLFETTKFSAPQKTVAVKVGREVFLSFLKHLSSVVRQDQQDDDISFDVESMPAVGKAKVRYVGGWAIRKVLETLRKSVKRNMFSLCSDTIAKVHKRHVMCELLEESIIIPYSKLEETTNLPETLQVTEERQFRERGLIHISDEAYKFFMCLEGRRVSLLNLQTMTKQKDMMVEVVKTQLKSDEALKEKWAECFSTTDAAVHKDLVDLLLEDVLIHYINMGTSQFLRDFRRQYDLKKSCELRRRVLQKKQMTKERSDSIPFKDILQDRSPGKHVSHGRLAQFIQQHNDVMSLCRVYTKPQLVALCEAYRIQVHPRWTKKVLAQHLAAAVKINTSIPLTVPVDDREYRVCGIASDRGSLRITLRIQ